jgi:hypothetical protein
MKENTRGEIALLNSKIECLPAAINFNIYSNEPHHWDAEIHFFVPLLFSHSLIHQHCFRVKVSPMMFGLKESSFDSLTLLNQHCFRVINQ